MPPPRCASSRMRSTAAPEHEGGTPAAKRARAGLDRVLKKQSDRLPAGKIFRSGERDCPSPGGIRKRTAFPPPPRATLPQRPSPPAPTEASARPGGCEAPAGGGAGAGRGLWPPPGLGSELRCGRGDGPCQDAPGAQAKAFSAFRSGSLCGRHFFQTPVRLPAPPAPRHASGRWPSGLPTAHREWRHSAPPRCWPFQQHPDRRE